MATAHLIHGYLGAGKTTLARRLERELPAIRFTHDEWMVPLFGTDPPAAEFPGLKARVDTLIWQVWPRCLGLGLNVVLDLNFWTRAERDKARAIAAAQGAECRLHDLRCTDATAWGRIEQRNCEPGNLYIARATFEDLKNRFEPLQPDENFVPALDSRS